MLMPGRDTVIKLGYRYRFNGKEQDNEPYGHGDEYDYGMRIYNPRIGRFLSVDPLTRKYPELTPYQFASNRPIDGVDQDGLEWELSTVQHNLNNQVILSNQVYLNSRTTVGPSKPSKTPTYIAIHKEYTQPTMGKLLFKPGYFGHYLLYNIFNDSKIVGSSFVNGGRNATDLIGNPTNEKQRISAFMNVASTAVGLEEFAGARFATAEGNAIIARASNDGVKVIVAESADDLNYLNAMGAKALYMAEGKGGSILITEDASRSTILEEAIHHEQRVTLGDNYFYKNLAKLEVEAQDKLLEIGKKEGWDQSELDEISRAKAIWQEKLKNEKK